MSLTERQLQGAATAYFEGCDLPERYKPKKVSLSGLSAAIRYVLKIKRERKRKR